MDEAVRVIVRCRPFSEKETKAGHLDVADINTLSRTVTISRKGDDPKTFTFDHVFDTNCSQTEVYSTTARDIVSGVLTGYNGTVLAYGQTGTGKTFTMEGIRKDPDLRGIIPMAFDHIFSHIKNAGADTQFLVRASYLEIYNEEIRDLLNGRNKRLEIKEHPETGVYVKDLSTYLIHSIKEMDDLMALGNKNRSVASTEMNATSSRSHSIFTITVEASELDPISGEQKLRAGKLHLVDLAGSERQSKTQSSGDRLKEAAKINLSLSALGNVISVLVDGKSTHIPYRDSKLTRLLQNSLGGNAKTLMVATISPASYNYEETLSTLRYANRAKNIKNKPKINEDPKDAMLREFQDEIKRLKLMLQDGATEVHLNGDTDESEEEEGLPIVSNRSSRVGHRDGLAESELLAMQESVKREKDAILASKDQEEVHKQKLIQEETIKSLELQREKAARAELALKLAELENKLLVGGVNILDQHQQQQIELARKAQIMEANVKSQKELEMHLNDKDELNLQIEEEFTNLQEEATAKSKKMIRLWNMYNNQKSELKEMKADNQRDREELLDTIRELSDEIKQKQFIIKGFIPAQEQEIIYDSAEYDETNGGWSIIHLKYAGNNRDKQSGRSTQERNIVDWDPQASVYNPYLSYDAGVLKRKEQKVKIGKRVEVPLAIAPKARGLVSAQKRYM